jgi:hypothetical protein
MKLELSLAGETIAALLLHSSFRCSCAPSTRWTRAFLSDDAFHRGQHAPGGVVRRECSREEEHSAAPERIDQLRSWSLAELIASFHGHDAADDVTCNLIGERHKA